MISPERLELMGVPVVDRLAIGRERGQRISLAALLAIAYLLMLVILSVLARYIAPHDPKLMDLTDQYQSPGLGMHLLGTDRFGHDELSQLIFGAQFSLLAAVIGTGVAVAVGAPLGVLAGYIGDTFENVTGFFNDALMAVPSLLFVLSAIAVIGSGLTRAMIVVGVIFSPPFFRLARAAARDVKHEMFIEASRSIGCSTWRTIWRHIIPNVLSPIVVQATFAAGASVAAEAGLSFLGLGVQLPSASWGTMLSTAAENYSAPFLIYFPGIAIALTVMSFLILGDWLSDVVGTQRRGRIP